MEIEKYIENRVDDQIKWFSQKSVSNKKTFLIIKITEILLASLIALGSGFLNKESYFPLVVGIMGAIIAILTGINSILKFQENWLQFRTTNELLKSEKYRFLTKTNIYNNPENRNEIFVEKIEGILNNENKLWQELIKSK